MKIRPAGVDFFNADGQAGIRIDGMDFYVIHILIINTSTKKCT